MATLDAGNASEMRRILERHFAAQGYEVAWDGDHGPRTIAFPGTLPDEIWRELHREWERIEIPHRPGTPKPSGFVGTSGPALRHENRDGVWNAITGHIEQGRKYVDTRDLKVLRDAGRVIVPLALIPRLWEAGHGIHEKVVEPSGEPAPSLGM